MSVDLGINIAAVIVVVYLLLMLFIDAIGLVRPGLDEFHVASRSLKPILLTGTFCATILGASATLGMAGLGFSKGLPGAWWMLSGTVGLIVLSALFAGKIRATGCYTLPELVGSFYGDKARAVASILIAISWLGVIAVQIVASGKVLVALLGGSEIFYMAVCTAVFILYTIHGGQVSVVKTDLVQFLIIIVGILILFSKSMDAVGPSALIRQSFPTSAQMGIWDVTSMLIVVGSVYLVGPDMYSRLFSAQSAEIAKKSAMISAFILIPLAFLITSLGIFARSIYPNISPEQAIPVLMTGLLSPSMAGVVAAALLAAFMSSADTSLMTATSILTLDIYRKAKPKSSERVLMAISRLGVLLIGFSALILAISLPNIIKTLLIVYTVFTNGMLIPVIAGFYHKQLGLTPHGALAALIGGGTTALLFGQIYPLLGMAVSAVLLIMVSRLDRLIIGNDAKIIS